jgi:hypothetical protein
VLHLAPGAALADITAPAFDRLARSFYMKVWNTTQVPFDLHHLTRDDYPVRPHWEKVFDEACVFPSNFSEMGYRLPIAA